jgi:hypothetical protein
MNIYSEFDASQFFPSDEECARRYFELDDYSIPEDAKLGPWGGNMYERTPEINERVRRTNLERGISPVKNGATEAARLVNTGRKQSNEHVKKRTEKQQKKCCVDGVIYNSMKEAASALGVTPAAITTRVRRGYTAWLI